MNVPHPRVSLREIKTWTQLRMSWYIFFFQIPRLPEWGLRRNGAQRVRDAFYNMATDKTHFPPEVLDVYARAAQQPGALTAMINYYRALLQTPHARQFGSGHIDTPTLMIWGEKDSALNINCTVGTEEWVPNLTLHRLPNVSHWVQQEAPEVVNALLEDWLE